MNEDIDWALKSLLSRASDYKRARDYYEGRQPLQFATEKFSEAFGGLFRAFADNVCGVVVETPADRLQVAGFTIAGKGEGQQDGKPTPVEDTMREIWRRNRMNKRAGEVHLDAVADGDAYVIVWPDADSFPVFYPNRGGCVTVRYDEEQPGYIVRAAKIWKAEDDHTRLTLYYRDRIEKYRSRDREQGGAADRASAYEEYDVEGESWPLPNPYDKVPVFHFANRASVGSMGRPEHSDAMPLQDANNKTIADMIVAMEFAAIKQRWATGLAEGSDPKMKPGGLWAVDTSDTKFGEFSETDITRFLTISEGFVRKIARATHTPIHYFFGEGAWPSGAALTKAEAPLNAKVEKKQVGFGNVWGDVMRFGLEIVGVKNADPEPVWRDATPKDGRETAEVGEIKRRLGVSRDQVLREIGYEAAEIEKFEEERATVDILPETIQ